MGLIINIYSVFGSLYGLTIQKVYSQLIEYKFILKKKKKRSTNLIVEATIQKVCSQLIVQI